eukprot:Rhum_TRINITY_DN14706_c13_g1::Rhum_TRINITY_DN14706_c13_g1_i1::g.112078::m.112078
MASSSFKEKQRARKRRILPRGVRRRQEEVTKHCTRLARKGEGGRGWGDKERDGLVGGGGAYRTDSDSTPLPRKSPILLLHTRGVRLAPFLYPSADKSLAPNPECRIDGGPSLNAADPAGSVRAPTADWAAPMLLRGSPPPPPHVAPNPASVAPPRRLSVSPTVRGRHHGFTVAPTSPRWCRADAAAVASVRAEGAAEAVDAAAAVLAGARLLLRLPREDGGAEEGGAAAAAAAAGGLPLLLVFACLGGACCSSEEAAVAAQLRSQTRRSGLAGAAVPRAGLRAAFAEVVMSRKRRVQRGKGVVVEIDVEKWFSMKYRYCSFY